MKYIQAKTPGEAWLKVLKEIIKNGLAIKDGEQNLIESLNVIVEIENPLESDQIIEKYADPKMIEWIKNNFLKQEPVLNWGYSYGQRFFNYEGLNQIEKVINKLRKNPDSKSATISLMNPPQDDAHMPCIVAIDFKVRNNVLVSTAFFRSQDAGKKLYADIISLGEISKIVAEKIGISNIKILVHIASLHIYETEWDKVNDMVKINFSTPNE